MIKMSLHACAVFVAILGCGACEPTSMPKPGTDAATPEDAASVPPASPDLAADRGISETPDATPDKSATAPDVADGAAAPFPAAIAAPALDCTAPSPSYRDARDGTEYCVSVAGVVNGGRSEFTCLPATRDLISVSPSSWLLRCSERGSGNAVRVEAPMRGAGTFEHSAHEAQSAIAKLHLLRFNIEAPKLAVRSQAPNLIAATVKETVSPDGAHVGTFEGFWGPAPEGCRELGYTCAEGQVRGSFRWGPIR